METRELDYDLPAELIAQHPLEHRDQSRLMVVRRRDESVEHARFDQLPELLESGDLLVCNDTRVVPAKIAARKTTGACLDGLFLREPAPGSWEVLLTRSRRLKVGERLNLDGCDHGLVIESRAGPGRWIVRLDPPGDTESVLEVAGRTPLPHYIQRRAGDKTADADDRRRYQTVFARHPGAVAAPTAGLHFSEPLLARLARAGIGHAPLTLHVGPGTFQPVTAEQLKDHAMHAEWFDLPESTVRHCEQVRAAGRRIVAVGTTSARVLEACADAAGRLKPVAGSTGLFVYPPYRFRSIDALITNFHLPRSTLLALVFAFAGIDLIRRAYGEAVASRYRFYSYGDAMLIL